MRGLYTFRPSGALENHISALTVQKVVVEEAQSRMNVLQIYQDECGTENVNEGCMLLKEAQSNRMCYEEVLYFGYKDAQSNRMSIIVEGIECLVTKTLHTLN